MTWGGLLALLVLVAVLVLFLIGKLAPEAALLFAALAIAILAAGYPVVWRHVA